MTGKKSNLLTNRHHHMTLSRSWWHSRRIHLTPLSCIHVKEVQIPIIDSNIFLMAIAPSENYHVVGAINF